MRRLFTLLIAVLVLAPAARAQDAVKERLEKSPRHLEWVKVKHDTREVKCFIAFPEVKEKATYASPFALICRCLRRESGE